MSSNHIAWVLMLGCGAVYGSKTKQKIITCRSKVIVFEIM